jgi:uncharacterized protein YndB with AHSA1/START domain
MSNTPFVIERTYNSPVDKVWDAITNVQKMREWYFDLPAFEAKVGFTFSFRGKGSKGEEYIHLCEVVEVVELKKISYTWKYEGYPGNSTVSFELFPENGQTRIRLTHAGLESFPQNTPDFAVSSFAAGWNEIIGKSLKEYLEKIKNEK